MKKRLMLIILLVFSFFIIISSDYFSGEAKIIIMEIGGLGEGTETDTDDSGAYDDNINIEQEVHKGCYNYQCVLIEGSGPDECFSVEDCLPENYHTECINNVCALVEGEGNNSCSSESNCYSPPTHTICKEMTCISINGSGIDKCLLNTDCLPEENSTHTKCIDQQCVEVKGKGKNECYTNNECITNATCEDNDIIQIFPNGINPFLKGETSNKTMGIEDWCIFTETDLLKEYYCEDSKVIQEVNIKCSTLGKYECSNGACIKKLSFFENLIRKIFS